MVEDSLASFLQHPGLKACLPETYCRSWDDDEWPVLVHKSSGVVVRSQAVRPSGVDASQECIILFHYTDQVNFDSICRSREPWDTLQKRPSNPKELCLGKGVYVSSREPADFETKMDILINRFSNAADSATQAEDIKTKNIMADYCIPILVPRSYAIDAVHGATIEMVHGAGFDCSGQLLRDGRDIWVVRAPDDVDAIALRLHDMDAEVRRVAVVDMVPYAMEGRLGALESILRCAEDANASVRLRAVEALSEVVKKRDQKTAVAITNLCGDRDESVRQAALQVAGDPLMVDIPMELKGVHEVNDQAAASTDVPEFGERAATDVRSRNEWTHKKRRLLNYVLLVLSLDLFLLLASVIALLSILGSRGALDGLPNLLCFPIALCSAIGSSSAARYARFLVVHCEDADDLATFQQSFQMRMYVEAPTVLAIISALFFTLLVIAENPLH